MRGLWLLGDFFISPKKSLKFEKESSDDSNMQFKAVNKKPLPSSSKDIALVDSKRSSALEHISPAAEQFIESLKNKSVNHSEMIQALLEKGHVTELELANIFGREMSLEIIKNLNDYKISKDVLDMIPKKVCEKNLIIPLVKIDKTLVVVFADPSDLNLRDNLQLITGHKIQPVVSTRTAIKEALNKYFDHTEDMDNLVYDMSFELSDLEEELGIDLDKKQDKKQNDPIISFVNLMFSDAIRLKSSDIHIETYDKEFRIRYRIDGVLYEKHNLSKDMANVVVSRIKVMSGMDISEKRKPQDARLKIILSGTELNMRVNSTPTVNGEKVVLRILDNSSLQEDMSKLGMEKFQMDIFMQSLFSPQGLILMTGPTGSGKTTTIYSGLLKLNTPQRNISTAEDPVEFRIHGINQVQMNNKAGLNFSSTLRAFLRQDPDIILVGEIRDLETAEIAFKASATGHLVLSTVHTNDTASTVTRLLSMGVPAYSVADNTSLIISQRLLRRLCDQCRILADEAYVRGLVDIGVSKEDLESYNGKVFKKNPNGCGYCNELGYRGRVAIYEMMNMTKAIKWGIFDKLSPIQLKKIAIEKDGLVSLRQGALVKLKKGLTSVDEVLRSTVFD